MRKLLAILIAASFAVSSVAFAGSHAGGKGDDKGKKEAK